MSLKPEEELFPAENAQGPRRIPAIPEDQNRILLKATANANADYYSGTVVSKSDLENLVYFNQLPKPKDKRQSVTGIGKPEEAEEERQAKIIGEIGSAKHRMVNAAIMAQLAGLSPAGIRDKISKSRGMKDFLKLAREQSVFNGELILPHLLYDATIDEIVNLKDNTFDVFGDFRQYYPETTFIFPVKSHGKRKIGNFHVRCDAVIFGDRAKGIVDYKTGGIFSRERTLFNLSFMACAWTVLEAAIEMEHKYSTPEQQAENKAFEKQNKKEAEERVQYSLWAEEEQVEYEDYGPAQTKREKVKETVRPARPDGRIIDRGLVYRSNIAISGIVPRQTGDSAIIWKDHIVTDKTFHLTYKEMALATLDAVGRLPYLLLRNREEVATSVSASSQDRNDTPLFT